MKYLDQFITFLFNKKIVDVEVSQKKKNIVQLLLFLVTKAFADALCPSNWSNFNDDTFVNSKRKKKRKKN